MSNEGMSLMMKLFSAVVVIVSVLWGGGAWVSTSEANQRALATTLDTVSTRAETNAARLSSVETDVEVLKRSSEDVVKATDDMQKTVNDLREITAEMRGLWRAKHGRKKATKTD
jgi:septation ring formation regulator EzrA